MVIDYDYRLVDNYPTLIPLEFAGWWRCPVSREDRGDVRQEAPRRVDVWWFFPRFFQQKRRQKSPGEVGASPMSLWFLLIDRSSSCFFWDISPYLTYKP